MQDYRDIANTRYVINRVFDANKTTAQLIEERIIKDKNNREALTETGNMLYNDIGGSIH